jgi:ankyrin repeat protein
MVWSRPSNELVEQRRIKFLIEMDDDVQLRKEIELGLDLELYIENEYTMLMTATKNNAYRCTLLLVEQGVNLNVKNRYGQTAVMLAGAWGLVQMAALLLKLGADIFHRNDFGRSLIDLVVKNSQDGSLSAWFELFGWYLDRLDEQDLTRYYELRLPSLFYSKEISLNE